MINTKIKIQVYLIVNSVLMVLMALVFFWERTGVLSWILFLGNIVGDICLGIYIFKPIIKAEKKLDELTTDVEKMQGEAETRNVALDEKIEKVFQWLQETSSREYKMQVLKKQAELNELQSQINPHFLYNTLESIRGEALMADMNEIADMTEALGYFFRYSISRKKTIVTLEDEIKNIQNYFLIQKFRFGDHIDMNIEVEEEKVKHYLVPKLTLQPIVENAIFHGLETQIEKGTINITIACTNQRLVLVISDDGIGIEEEELLQLNDKLNRGVDFSEKSEERNRNGIALDNVNQRIKIRFGNEYGLHVYSTLGCGTDVVVSLPVVEHEQKYEDSI